MHITSVPSLGLCRDRNLVQQFSRANVEHGEPIGDAQIVRLLACFALGIGILAIEAVLVTRGLVENLIPCAEEHVHPIACDIDYRRGVHAAGYLTPAIMRYELSAPQDLSHIGIHAVDPI